MVETMLRTEMCQNSYTGVLNFGKLSPVMTLNPHLNKRRHGKGSMGKESVGEKEEQINETQTEAKRGCKGIYKGESFEKSKASILYSNYDAIYFTDKIAEQNSRKACEKLGKNAISCHSYGIFNHWSCESANRKDFLSLSVLTIALCVDILIGGTPSRNLCMH
jgi:hypothetical protein